jgi:DNA uptake protein ComE-like DNA-binding protein
MLSARKHPGLKRHPIPGREENKPEEFSCGDPVRSVARRDFLRTVESAVRSSPGRSEFVPSETHKMTSAERRDTASANGQPADLNGASKKDLAALPGIGPHYAQSIIDARRFGSTEDLLKKKLIPQET